jgi:hypothetical protein
MAFMLLQIVWDSEKKRWTNTDGDEGEGNSCLMPPPKGPTSGPNAFKMYGPGKGK